VPKNLITSESRAILALIPQTIISVQTFFWTFPFSVLLATILIPLEINGAQELLSWFCIAVLGHISMLPFVIYSKNKSGLKKQVPLLLLMGIVRGGVIGLLAPLFGVIDQLEIPFRVITSMISVFYLFLIAAVFYEFRYSMRKELAKKIKEATLSQVLIEDFSDDVNSHVLISRISQLQEKILSTLNGVPSQENFKDRAKDIDGLVRKYIRPLSKSQWHDGQLVWVKAGFIRMIWGSLSIAPLNVWAVLFLTMPFSFVGQYNRYGLLNTLITQVAWLCAAWLVQKIAKKLQPAKDGNYLKQNLIILFLVTMLITPAMYWIHEVWFENSFSVQNQIASHILSAFTTIFLLCASSVIISLQEEKAYVVEILGNVINENEFQQVINSGSRANRDSQYGQYLHAEVQSQLLACKLLLLKAAESNFTLFSPEVTNQINQRLEQIQQPYARPAVRIPYTRAKELAKSWTGLAEITFELSPEMSESNPNSDVISQLIEESVVNSIRHGNAKKVHIENCSTAGQVDFIVTDDGYFKAGQSQGGLGTILFNTFTETWSINREGEKTILKFSVRI
jgi:hypothetical protein